MPDIAHGQRGTNQEISLMQTFTYAGMLTIRKLPLTFLGRSYYNNAGYGGKCLSEPIEMLCPLKSPKDEREKERTDEF
jgi:hypothetical protein